MGIQEIISEVSKRLVGFLTNLKTVAKDSIVSAINELFIKFVSGDENQAIVPKSDNSSDYKAIDIVTRGTFVTTDAELTAAKLIYVSPATIFSSWKRFSHGGGTYGSGSPVLSDVIPGIPLETNSWSYNAGTNTINSTVNSASHIGFYSPDKYSDYTHSVTLSATDGDNDFIAVIIAYVEDKNDMVTNHALGLNPSDFSWPIDVTSATIPNQHTITLVRGRTVQANHPFATPARYAIVYDLGKLTQQILVNGETSGVWNTSNSYTSSPTVDVKIIRQGDLIKATTTDWSDAPGGKGALRFELTYDLTSLTITNKFRGAASYGFSAITQQNSNFTNDFFSPNINSIYDVRNGDKWIGDNAGNYTLSSTETLYTDFGARRLFYNQTTDKLIEVWPDKTFDVVGGASLRFGIEDNTSDVDRYVDMQGHEFLLDNLQDFYAAMPNGAVLSAAQDHFAIGTTKVGVSGNDDENGVPMTSIRAFNETFGRYINVYGNSITVVKQEGATVVSTNNLPLSVNGQFADATGNITVSTGGSTTGLVAETRTLTINGTTYDLSANRSWTISAGSGTVTSVAVSMPGVIFNPTVTGSPITTSGTLTPTLKTQVANTALLGPASGADATPTFRAITNSDIAPITGLLTNLNTTDKTLLVNAINEVLAKVSANYITQNQKISSLAINSAQSII